MAQANIKGKDFIYCDNFTMSKGESKKLTCAGDKYYANWLNMIYQRLLLSRDFLTEDGMIFISIDDSELDNMLKMCNEIFGEKNYINTISVNTKMSSGASGGGEDKRLKKNIEYVIVFCKDIEILKVLDYEIRSIKQIAKEENITEKEVYYKYFDRIMATTNAQTSIRGRVWEATDQENNMYIASYVPKSGKHKGEKIQRIFMGKQKVLVIWLKDTAAFREGVLWKKEKIGTYWEGLSWINVSKEGAIRYSNGKKPIDLLRRMFQLFPMNEDMTVMDFFSGSATIGHAAMQEYVAYLKKQGIAPVITEIGKARLDRAGEQIKKKTENAQIDTGYRVFRVVNSSIGRTGAMAEDESRALTDVKDEDIIYEIMLHQWKVPLTSSIECLQEINVHTYMYAKRYLICLEPNKTEELLNQLATLEPFPYKYIFRTTMNGAKKVLSNWTQKRNKVISDDKDLRSIVEFYYE